MIPRLLQVVPSELAKVHSIEVESVAVAARTKVPLLRHFFLRQLYADLFFFAFAQDRERNGWSLRKTANEFRKLIRLGQDLVVQHLKDVILLNAGSGRRTIRNDIINDQSKTSVQSELL